MGLRGGVRLVLVLLLLTAAGFLARVWALERGAAVEDKGAATIEFAPAADAAEFARVLEPRSFSFPPDHGPHPEYRTEWWYYTGNLNAPGSAHFGYQLTFFRVGLAPEVAPRLSRLAASQIYFAHFALSRPDGGYQSFERFSRGAGDLAGASGAPFTVWLENWSAGALDETGTLVALAAGQEGLGLDLVLQAAKPIVAHGDGGVSAKGDEPGNASYYLSATRMSSQGRVQVGEESFTVAGSSWFDHEWGTSALPASAVGWDWFGLQLSDGRDLMLYRIRGADGAYTAASSGTLVEADGTAIHLRPEDFVVEAGGSWRSPRSRAVYPARWSVRVPSAGVDLEIEPWQADQEVDARVVYWEGAVRIRGVSRGESVQGVGFVELTGYAESMQGQF
jgi:predicted secreted hydrolase